MRIGVLHCTLHALCMLFASAEGMSTRAIAPIVGAGFNTVARDLRSVPNGTDDPRPIESMDGITRTLLSVTPPGPPTSQKY